MPNTLKIQNLPLNIKKTITPKLCLKNTKELRYRILRIIPEQNTLLAYYFNSSHQYTYQRIDKNTTPPAPLIWQTTDKTPIVNDKSAIQLPTHIGDTVIDTLSLKLAIGRLKPQDHLDTLIYIYNEIIQDQKQLKPKPKQKGPSELDIVPSYDQLRNRVLKQLTYNDHKNTRLYFFDSNLRYAHVDIINPCPLPEHLIWPNQTKHTPTAKPNMPDQIKDHVINKQALRIAIDKLQQNDTPYHLMKYYEALRPVPPELPKERPHETKPDRPTNNVTRPTAPLPTFDTVDKFVLRIDKPKIERELTNPNKDTFDFVRIFLAIPQKHPNRSQFIRNHLKEINRMALAKIQNNTSYKRYGVPINFLRLTEYTITRQSELMLLYELKAL